MVFWGMLVGNTAFGAVKLVTGGFFGYCFNKSNFSRIYAHINVKKNHIKATIHNCANK
jgi:hypothetical protein